jgi:hypothetical protein
MQRSNQTLPEESEKFCVGDFGKVCSNTSFNFFECILPVKHFQLLNQHKIILLFWPKRIPSKKGHIFSFLEKQLKP